jgi:hypothetical protein
LLPCVLVVVWGLPRSLNALDRREQDAVRLVRLAEGTRVPTRACYSFTNA